MVDELENRIAILEQENQSLKQRISMYGRAFKGILPDPGDRPHMPGVDIWGELHQCTGSQYGGDHFLYVNFNDMQLDELAASNPRISGHVRNNKNKTGVMVADVAGHGEENFGIVARLHDMFRLATANDIREYGEVTPRVFRTLNNRLYLTDNVRKFVTAIYGEINSEGVFRYVVAGHPFPLVYSSERKELMSISPKLVHNDHHGLKDDHKEDGSHAMPLGLYPSPDDVLKIEFEACVMPVKFNVFQCELLSPGDILLLYSDGFYEPTADQYKVRELMKDVLDEHKDGGAKQIAKELMKQRIELEAELNTDMDDKTIIVIKKY